MKNKMKILLTIFCAIILVLAVKGKSGNPTETTMNDLGWTTNGPFELSPERGRFALTYSLVENKSVGFSIPVARFASPDVGYKDGRYVSLFAQGVSFLSIPGYLIGKFFGASQVGAFLTSSFFAIFNFILIRVLAKRLGASNLFSTIGGLIFLFATPAFTYATTLYQHHISTFLILSSIYALINFDDFKGLMVIFFLYSFGVSIDYPNAFIMFPILIYSLGKLISKKVRKDKTFFAFHVGKIITILAVVPPLIFFIWFNNLSYGSPTQLAGTVESVAVVNERGFPIFKSVNEIKNEEKQEEEKKLEVLDRGNSALAYFKTRNLRNGLFILLISSDRGVIFYVPVLIFFILGFRQMRKNENNIAQLLILLMGTNLILYSMWGDPWGGWAFGSRYLIPSYALASIFLSLGLKNLVRQKILLVIFYILLAYSVAINTAAAVTSNSNPPKIEAIALEEISGKIERYSVDRNFDYLTQNKSKSYFFNEAFSEKISLWTYYTFVSVGIFLVITSLMTYTVMYVDKKLDKYD